MTDIQTRLRALSTADATQLLHWLRRDTSDAKLLRPVKADAIANLLASGKLRGMVIEYRRNQAETWSMGAIAFSGFVTQHVADDLETNSGPWFMARLLAAEISGKTPVFLTMQEIAAGNSSGGLDLVLDYMQDGWDLKDPLWWAVAGRAHDGYLKDHCGYRLRRAFQEGWEAKPDLYLATGYRKLASFPLPAGVLAISRGGVTPTSRAIYFADVAHVRSAAPGSTISKVFHFREPKCFFTLCEQELLAAAGRGLTDAEILAELDMSRQAVKQAWSRIYSRIDTHVPGVTEHLTGPSSKSRGKEKRRLVLKYVENHPEEMRPVRRRRGAAAPRRAAGSPKGKAR